jgi:hypothetical protein
MNGFFHSFGGSKGDLVQLQPRPCLQLNKPLGPNTRLPRSFALEASVPFARFAKRAGSAFVDVIQLREQLRILRNPFIVFFGEPDYALPVDDEYRPLGKPLRSQAIILRANRAVRPKVREHRKSNSTHLLGKGFVRERRVHAYAQNLSISGFEFLAILFEAAELSLSATGKVERIERQYDILLSLVIC